MACLLGLTVGALGLELVEQGVAQLLGLVVGQRLGANLHGRRRAVADDHHGLGIVAQRLPEDLLHLADLVASPRGNDIVVPPLKSMPKVNPRNTMLSDCDRDDRPADRVPQPAPTNDLERAGAGVEAR